MQTNIVENGKDKIAFFESHFILSTMQIFLFLATMEDISR